jgi:hypothetical protein
MSKPMLLKAAYKSGLEVDIAEDLDAEGIEYTYEGEAVPYRVPERVAKYFPDFPRVNGTNIYIEGKGRFGHFRGDGAGAKERQKLILVKEQHPEMDIRLIFTSAKKPIYKGSKTTYAKWADDHGFKWAEKRVPRSWIEEIKRASRH